jgi:hypothetical protein
MQNFSNVDGFDTEIENMRQEGLEKHNISIFVEEREFYIHSRIVLHQVLSSVEQASKLSNDFGNKVTSSLGKILKKRIKWWG